jgi:hypothetical protein
MTKTGSCLDHSDFYSSTLKAKPDASRMKLHPKAWFFVGQVTVPAQKTEGGIIKPDSAFLLTGRCGDLPYENRGFNRSFTIDQTDRSGPKDSYKFPVGES